MEPTGDPTIEPARILASADIDGTPISELDPGRGIQTLVEAFTRFKSELDRRLVAASKPGALADPWLRERGFVKTPNGRGVDGRSFIRWLFGPFWLPQPATRLCRVPAWACIGWNRKQRPALAAADAGEVMQWLDQQTREDVGERAIATWLAPFPLVLMGEGQNRVDLFVAHGQPLLAQLRVATLPSPENLRLVRVLGCEDLVALHCLDRRFWFRFEASALLPFPALAVPLLEAYGVRWARGRHLLTPYSAALREARHHPWNDPTHSLARWRPSRWRSMFLSQAYV